MSILVFVFIFYLVGTCSANPLTKVMLASLFVLVFNNYACPSLQNIVQFPMNIVTNIHEVPF